MGSIAYPRPLTWRIMFLGQNPSTFFDQKESFLESRFFFNRLGLRFYISIASQIADYFAKANQKHTKAYQKHTIWTQFCHPNPNPGRCVALSLRSQLAAGSAAGADASVVCTPARRASAWSRMPTLSATDHTWRNRLPVGFLSSNVVEALTIACAQKLQDWPDGRHETGQGVRPTWQPGPTQHDVFGAAMAYDRSLADLVQLQAEVGSGANRQRAIHRRRRPSRSARVGTACAPTT